jgi:hypothetical protein
MVTTGSVLLAPTSLLPNTDSSGMSPCSAHIRTEAVTNTLAAWRVAAMGGEWLAACAASGSSGSTQAHMHTHAYTSVHMHTRAADGTCYEGDARRGALPGGRAHLRRAVVKRHSHIPDVADVLQRRLQALLLAHRGEVHADGPRVVETKLQLKGARLGFAGHRLDLQHLPVRLGIIAWRRDVPHTQEAKAGIISARSMDTYVHASVLACARAGFRSL